MTVYVKVLCRSRNSVNQFRSLLRKGSYGLVKHHCTVVANAVHIYHCSLPERSLLLLLLLHDPKSLIVTVVNRSQMPLNSKTAKTVSKSA